MNKIPVYICIAILLGQVMLFSSEDGMFKPSIDAEFNDEILSTSARNGTGPMWDISVVDSNGAVGQYSAIAIDSNDDTHISYYDDSNGDLKHATDQSGSWVSNTVASNGDIGLIIFVFLNKILKINQKLKLVNF